MTKTIKDKAEQESRAANQESYMAEQESYMANRRLYSANQSSRVAYFCTIGASLLLMILFETGVLSGGWMAVEKQIEFVVATVMVLVTMGCAPLSLRFLHFKRVADAINSGKWNVQGNVFIIRLLLLGIPMFTNTLLYYAFMSPRFGYMAIILLLCLLSQYPSFDKESEEDCQ